MPITLREFQKVEIRILDDHRFFTLSDFDQLLYLKLLLVAKKTGNKIPKNPSIIRALLRCSGADSDIESGLIRIKENFPKFNENKYFWYFDDLPSRAFKNGTDRDRDKDREKEGEFEVLWASLRRKEGKKEALRHFCAARKLHRLEDITKAINNYNAKIEVEKIEPKYIKMGSTLFHNWEDYLDYEPIKPKEAFSRASLNKKY